MEIPAMAMTTTITMTITMLRQWRSPLESVSFTAILLKMCANQSVTDRLLVFTLPSSHILCRVHLLPPCRRRLASQSLFKSTQLLLRYERKVDGTNRIAYEHG